MIENTIKKNQLIEIYYNPHLKYKGYFQKIENNSIWIKELYTNKLNYHYINHIKIYCVNTKNNIYLITNLKNGKKYIGRTIKDINERFLQHKRESRQKYSQTPLHIEIQKYGIENFKIEKIYEFNADTQKEANKIEQFYIKKYNTKIPNGYNVA